MWVFSNTLQLRQMAVRLLLALLLFLETSTIGFAQDATRDSQENNPAGAQQDNSNDSRNSATRSESEQVENQLLQQLQKPIGEDLGQPSQESPLERVANQMRQAGPLIGQPDKAAETRRIQQSIVGALEELIKQQEPSSASPREKRGSDSSQTAGKQPPKDRGSTQKNADPSPKSNATGSPTIATGSVTAPAEAARSFLQQLWGHLPARARQQVSQEWGEEFLPKYELQLEDYFRRLAEEAK